MNLAFMNRLLTLILTLLSLNTFAQISNDGIPVSTTFLFSKAIPNFITEAIDIQSIQNEDAVTDNYKNIAWRFGIELPVNLTLNNSGIWESLPNGDRVWRLKITVPNAKSINLNYNHFFLPNGATFFVYNKENTLGGFNSSNNKINGKFSTSLLKGESVTLEYYEPQAEAGKGIIHVSSVVHGYRDLFSQLKTFGQSGACNVNTVCDTILWGDEIRSVVMILTAGNTRFCTGALINNVLQDGTPYVLTADHCGISSNNIFMFNYQSADCSPSIDGPTNQTISGCSTMANNPNSDFYLVRLSSTPPLSYNVFYAGWSNIDIPAINGTGIHHPRGDVKKISHDNDPLIASGYYGTGNDHWEVLDWNSGTTEGGSSGSPLFDQNHRIVGQLHGGDANCGNDAFDYYGKFATSWNSNTDTSKQLKHWLDPNNTGATIIDGFDPNGANLNLDANALSIEGIPKNVCGDSIFPLITIRNKGSNILNSLDIYYSLDGATPSVFNWTGNIPTFGTTTISLPPYGLTSGNYNYTFYTSNPNGSLDQNFLNDTISTDFTVNATPLFATLNLTTDDWGSETSWNVIDNNTNNTVLEGGGYPNVTGGQMISENLCLYDGCFTFTLNDAANDGYCCAFGTGNMLITEDSTGDTLAIENTNSFIGNSISFSFCMGSSSGINELITNNFDVYPNPNTGTFNIRFSESTNPLTIKIHDMLGKLVYRQENIDQKTLKIDLNNDLKGFYLVSVLTDKGKKVTKILVN